MAAISHFHSPNRRSPITHSAYGRVSGRLFIAPYARLRSIAAAAALLRFRRTSVRRPDYDDERAGGSKPLSLSQSRRLLSNGQTNFDRKKRLVARGQRPRPRGRKSTVSTCGGSSTSREGPAGSTTPRSPWVSPAQTVRVISGVAKDVCQVLVIIYLLFVLPPSSEFHI